MNSIKNIQRLNERELENAVPSSASWHTDYLDTAYIYVGGLGFDLSEGDIVTIFSQYGDLVWIKLARDKETGKSRGFAWLKYEDQRSCDLAVDNLSGASVMGRLLAVDHARYKKRDDEDEMDGYIGQETLGDDRASSRRNGDDAPNSSDDGSEDNDASRPLIREEVELRKLLQDHDDDDPMKAYMVETKKEEIARALESRTRQASSRETRHKEHHHRRSHRRHRSRSRSPREHRRRRSSRSRSEEDGQRARRRTGSERRGDSRDRDRDRKRRDRSEDRSTKDRHRRDGSDDRRRRSRREQDDGRRR